MYEIANRQAKDITELRRATEEAVEMTICSTPQQLTAGTALALTSPQPSDAGRRRSSGEKWRNLLQEATTQQQQAIARGQAELRELAAMLQANYEAESRRQASEWKAPAAQSHGPAPRLVARPARPSSNAVLPPCRAGSAPRDQRGAPRGRRVPRAMASVCLPLQRRPVPLQQRDVPPNRHG